MVMPYMVVMFGQTVERAFCCNHPFHVIRTIQPLSLSLSLSHYYLTEEGVHALITSYRGSKTHVFQWRLEGENVIASKITGRITHSHLQLEFPMSHRCMIASA